MTPSNLSWRHCGQSRETTSPQQPQSREWCVQAPAGPTREQEGLQGQRSRDGRARTGREALEPKQRVPAPAPPLGHTQWHHLPPAQPKPAVSMKNAASKTDRRRLPHCSSKAPDTTPLTALAVATASISNVLSLSLRSCLCSNITFHKACSKLQTSHL